MNSRDAISVDAALPKQYGTAKVMSMGNSYADALHELHRRRQLALGQTRSERIRNEHERGFLTVGERLELLIDPGSRRDFAPLVHSDEPSMADLTLGGGEWLGFASIDGRSVAYQAGDSTAIPGAAGAGSARRRAGHRRVVERNALPLFEFGQGGGAPVNRDMLSSRWAGIAGHLIGARDVLPRRGSYFFAALGHVYAPWEAVEADFSVMTRNSTISFVSPAVLAQGTGERLQSADYGGPAIHAQITGQVDAVADDDADAMALLRRAFSYLPGNVWEEPPIAPCDDPPSRRDHDLVHLLPENFKVPYDVRDVIRRVTDRDSFFEYGPTFAPNIVSGLARMCGHTVGVLANQPLVKAGALDAAAAIKAKRLFKVAGTFSLPVLFFQDTPGALTTKEEEERRLLSLVYELSAQRLNVGVPKISIVLRKGYGFPFFVMSGGDPEWHTFAWPRSEIGFMGPETGAAVTYRKEITTAANPRAHLLQRAEEFRPHVAPWIAARLGYLDDIIDPADTRPTIIRALRASWRRMRETEFAETRGSE